LYGLDDADELLINQYLLIFRTIPESNYTTTGRQQKLLQNRACYNRHFRYSKTEILNGNSLILFICKQSFKLLIKRFPPSNIILME